MATLTGSVPPDDTTPPGCSLRVPSFSVALDVWWQEPGLRGDFRTGRPFFELPNVLGSPHVSANTYGSIGEAARHAAENVARYLRGEAVRHVVDRSEYAT